MKTIAGTLFALALSALVYAQSTLTGKWEGKTGGSAQAIVLDVTAKGATLTGTLTVNNETSKITDGNISKTSFTFKASLDGRTDDGFTGEIGTDQIRLWPDRMGAERAVTLKRAK